MAQSIHGPYKVICENDRCRWAGLRLSQSTLWNRCHRCGSRVRIMDEQTPVPTEEQYALAVDGEGATCVVVPRCDLHNALHGLMCACGSEWDCCETEGVSETCQTLDDEDHWTFPDSKPFRWTYDSEECPITVTRLTMPLGIYNRNLALIRQLREALVKVGDFLSVLNEDKAWDELSDVNAAITAADAVLGESNG